MPSSRRQLLIALLVAGTFFMETLDGTVIATALPQMAVSFKASAVDLGIGMTAYLLTLAVFIPISGWIADRYGARSVYAAAIALFTVASVLCGLSNGVWTFTGARILQGIGGAMMVPVGRLVVLRVTPKVGLMQAISFITWPGLTAPVLGPPVGGFITTYASWRWIFFLNVPVGLVAMALAFYLVPNERGQRRPFDALGFLFTGVALTALMYGLELLGRQELPWRAAIVSLAVGAAAGVAALWQARRHPHPLLDLSAFAVRTYRITVAGGSLFRTAISSLPFLLPLMFQLAFGLSAFSSGLLVLSLFAGNLGMKMLTTPALRRFGFRRVLIVNGIVVVLSILACSFLTPATPVALVIAVLFVGGLARSMQFTSLSTIGFADIPQGKMSGANTLASMIVQITMAGGIAVGAIALRVSALIVGGGDDRAAVLAQFHLAFALMAVLAAAAIIDCLGLAPDAGAEVSGHRPRRAAG